MKRVKNSYGPRYTEVAAAVKDTILQHRITKIHTRGILDRIIELEKFPHTKNYTDNGKLFLRKTAYANKQYDNVRNELINSGFLRKDFDGYRYSYTVVKPRN